jgi:ribosomal protein S18 acetylase RimI-like enzyme
MGWTYFKRFRLEIDLDKPLFPAPRLPPGYAFAPWNGSLLEVHAETKYRCFRWEIDSDVFPSLSYLDGCLRLMREIVDGEAFVPSATWLLKYADPATGKAAYCGTIQGLRIRPELGDIQNVGITPEHRGRGLGTALLHKALEGFREAGIRRVGLEVTAKNLDAQRLYHRLGFRKIKTVYKSREVAFA